ncbi:MAG: SpoIIE family protein phosphatase, partial [Clostridia bacterium]|nr:SpoIIE family protein phosphatase [Clostridia bacterium]
MKKRGKIARRTLISVFFTVAILIVSISVSTGFQLRNVLIEKYSAFAMTYVRAAADYIDGDTIKQYVATGRKDAYYEEINKYLNATMNSSAEDANIQYIYVFIPGEGEREDEYVAIWDAELEEEPLDLLESYPYSEGAKEQAEKIFNKELKEDAKYYVDAENGTPTLTVSMPLLDSSNNVVAIIAADLSVHGINNALGSILTGILIPVAGIMLLTMVTYYFFIKQGIIQPIIKLQKATEEIVDHLESDKTADFDIHTHDEIEMLADSFSGMTDKLRDYIAQNAAITAEKERIGAELELATRIQADMLPNIFPAFPERDDFDVYATMTPAKEVGGDFYDFFLVDETRLAMVVADVSGKGVPAALFMMMCKILIQNQVMAGKSPAEALEIVNNQICSNNREEMFVTVWLGILDLKTGLLTASNAGHEKPIVMMPGGEFELFKDRHGFVIGGMEGVKYKEYQIQLEPGAKVFAYTDGVVEATSESDELFGSERTVEALNAFRDGSPETILHETKRAVDRFVGNAPQFDDLTMLCVEYIGMNENSNQKNEITIDNEVSEIARAIDFVAERTEDLPFSLKV